MTSKWVILCGTFQGITDFAEQFSKFKKEANFANLENMTGNGYKRKALANTNSSNSKVISKVLEKSENYEKSEKSQKFRERIRARIRKYQQSRYIWARFSLRHFLITSYSHYITSLISHYNVIHLSTPSFITSFKFHFKLIIWNHYVFYP